MRYRRSTRNAPLKSCLHRVRHWPRNSAPAPHFAQGGRPPHQQIRKPIPARILHKCTKRQQIGALSVAPQAQAMKQVAQLPLGRRSQRSRCTRRSARPGTGHRRGKARAVEFCWFCAAVLGGCAKTGFFRSGPPKAGQDVCGAGSSTARWERAIGRVGGDAASAPTAPPQNVPCASNTAPSGVQGVWRSGPARHWGVPLGQPRGIKPPRA